MIFLYEIRRKINPHAFHPFWACEATGKTPYLVRIFLLLATHHVICSLILQVCECNRLDAVRNLSFHNDKDILNGSCCSHLFILCYFLIALHYEAFISYFLYTVIWNSSVTTWFLMSIYLHVTCTGNKISVQAIICVDYDLCVIHGKFWVWIPASGSAILTEIFHGCCQPLLADEGTKPYC